VDFMNPGSPQYPVPMMPGYQESSQPYMPPYGQQPYMMPQLPPIQRPPQRQERPNRPSKMARFMMRRHSRDPFLANQLTEIVGQDVHVVTYMGDISGTLSAVFPDHLLIEGEEKKYHVRLDAVGYISPANEND
jgi:hypothetical protein